MDNKRQLTFNQLVCSKTNGLGFCCEYAFFRVYKRTGLIATRLGVHEATVRTHKALFNSGTSICLQRPGCMISILRRLKK